MPRPGIYERLIDCRLAQELDQLPENQKATAAIDLAEASSVLSQYVADVVRKALERMHDGRSELLDQVALVNQLVAMVYTIAICLTSMQKLPKVLYDRRKKDSDLFR